MISPAQNINDVSLSLINQPVEESRVSVNQVLPNAPGSRSSSNKIMKIVKIVIMVALGVLFVTFFVNAIKPDCPPDPHFVRNFEPPPSPFKTTRICAPINPLDVCKVRPYNCFPEDSTMTCIEKHNKSVNFYSEGIVWKSEDRCVLRNIYWIELCLENQSYTTMYDNFKQARKDYPKMPACICPD